METNVGGFLRDHARLLGWLFVACVIPGVFLLTLGAPTGVVLALAFLGSALVSWKINPAAVLVKMKPKPTPKKDLSSTISPLYASPQIVYGLVTGPPLTLSSAVYLDEDPRVRTVAGLVLEILAFSAAMGYLVYAAMKALF